MLTEISGVFVKIAFASDVEILLERGLPNRPPNRFNRVGQNALYLSPNEESARVAMEGYVKEGDPERVLLRYEVDQCKLFDLRHPDAAEIHALACLSWRDVLAKGQSPKSWKVAEYLRESNYVGLIDPSRRRPGWWHITLFRWNENDAPYVKRVGMPTPIILAAD